MWHLTNQLHFSHLPTDLESKTDLLNLSGHAPALLSNRFFGREEIQQTWYSWLQNELQSLAGGSASRSMTMVAACSHLIITFNSPFICQTCHIRFEWSPEVFPLVWRCSSWAHRQGCCFCSADKSRRRMYLVTDILIPASTKSDCQPCWAMHD